MSEPVEECEHHFECINYGMVRNEKDPLHIYVTEVCTHCLKSRALTFRRLVEGEWMSVPEFQTMHKDNIIKDMSPIRDTSEETK